MIIYALLSFQAREDTFPWLPIIGGCVGFVVVVALIVTIILICRRYVPRLIYHFFGYLHIIHATCLFTLIISAVALVMKIPLCLYAAHNIWHNAKVCKSLQKLIVLCKQRLLFLLLLFLFKSLIHISSSHTNSGFYVSLGNPILLTYFINMHTYVHLLTSDLITKQA